MEPEQPVRGHGDDRLSTEQRAMLRRWWRRLPLAHPFVEVIRRLAGELDDDGSEPPGPPGGRTS